MNKKCAFTICTSSYVGIANTLRDSFLNYHPDYDFFVVVVDYRDDGQANILDSHHVLNKYLTQERIRDMEFQYNVTEYCTSVKPYSMLYFLEQHYELVAYIDPDILFFSRFEELDDRSFNAFVTPHVLTYSNDWKDNEGYLRCGVFNCGFIAFRKCQESIRFLNWWGSMLETSCFDDSKRGIYTDQKWADFVPAFFHSGDCCVIRNPGCNFAPWNFFERKVIKEDDVYYAGYRKETEDTKHRLCFVHFSGFKYNLLSTGKVEHGFRELVYHEDIDELLKIYGRALEEHGINRYLAIPYKHNFYDNGNPIHPFHRRLYETMKADYQNDPAPFSPDGQFYADLQSGKMIIKRDSGSFATSIQTTSSLGKKEKLLKIFYKVCFKVLGFKTYTELLKGLQLYSREDHQTWLIKK